MLSERSPLLSNALQCRYIVRTESTKTFHELLRLRTLSLNFVIEPYRVYFVLHWLNWESCETYGSKKLSNFEIWTALNQFESIWIYFNHLEAFGSDSLESVKLNRSVERRAGESFKFKVWELFWLQAIAQSPGKSIKCINFKCINKLNFSYWSISTDWSISNLQQFRSFNGNYPVNRRSISRWSLDLTDCKLQLLTVESQLSTYSHQLITTKLRTIELWEPWVTFLFKLPISSG